MALLRNRRQLPNWMVSPLDPQPAHFNGNMFPAPMRGLDVRTTLVGQSPDTATILRNVWCRRYGNELRAGYRRWASNMAEVVSVMSYQPPRGTGSSVQSKLFAACVDGNVYDVSSPSADGVTLTPAVNIPSQLSPGQLSWTNFSTQGSNYLCVCAAGAGYWTYDLSGGWVNRSASLTPGAGTDPTALTLDFVMSWKNRLWFIGNNMTKACYLPVGSIQGVANGFDFGPLFVHGGDLKAMASWTVDAGDGIDDKLVAVGGGGDVLVYEGTDPTSATTFQIVGRWFVGRPPAGRRFMGKFGGDLTIITSNGIERMSNLLQARGLLQPGAWAGQQGDDPWQRYMETIARDVRLTSDQSFWHLIYLPSEQSVFITTPHKTRLDSLQYAFGIFALGWSEMDHMPMACAELHGDDLFFGTTDGKVCKAFFGDTDDQASDGTPGSSVIADIQTSFSAVAQDLFHTKRMLMAMPMFQSTSPPSVKAQINTDWSFQGVPSSPIYTASQTAKWDVAKWDQAKYAGLPRNYFAWAGAEGLGTHASLRMSFTGDAKTTFTAWKLVTEIGRGIM